ncbi:CHAD domain-containing protein [Bradyrhizobium sp. BRP22]|uniref:CYTH and CHAD domain-containing protein n=1 Tax=Bradyrhizobium sp. BRP22 TaxID=2793821 RepID=UPI001CD1A64B|nr:CYTH and CHAD domain-containing protein [Bradyrhizobium sp. BRP22]MCA1455645.1 CHAD domain-containing protein [Bradyrhizobium sp. BRP22]
MAVETELKFSVAARNLKSLAGWRIPGGKMGERSDSDLVSTYFDTGKHKLRRHGLTLRVRQNGRTNIQTVKAANGAQLGRGEWEAEIKDDAPDLRGADGTPLEPLASRKLRRKLKPVFKTSVHRTTVPVRTRKSEIELAIDRGRIVAGHRASPIEEFELELKSGRLADLFRVARAIERRSGAELDLRSKSDRGYGLAQGREEQVVFAEPIELEAGMTASEAFRVIARATVRHFSGNADAVRNLDSEGVHQMRVGLRRLRAAISLFSKVLPRSRTGAVKRELKWLTGELAPAREIDVFIREQVEPITLDRELSRGGKAIKDEFGEKRAHAFARAKRAVSSERFRRLLVDTLEWIELKPSEANGQADVPIEKFAADVLRRRTRKTRKEGVQLDRLSPRARHKLRIRIKKIRYAVDFFEGLFPARRERKRLARLSRHLKNIQDALGALNDFVAHRKMALAAALQAPRENRRARALAAGVMVGREDKSVRPLMKTALKEARRLQVM